jgi:hypothetical protein
MMTLDGAIRSVQSILGGISGIRSAPDYPPDSVNQGLTIITRPGPGNWQYRAVAPLDKRGQHTIIIELMTPHRDMARDIQALCGYLDIIPDALMQDVTLRGAADQIGDIRTDGLVRLEYNGIDMLAIRWHLENVYLVTEVG